MNLKQFLAEIDKERSFLWGAFFQSEAEAIAAKEFLSPRCNTEIVESLLLLDNENYYKWWNAWEYSGMKAQQPVIDCCDSLLFTTPELAQKAKTKICDQFKTNNVVVQGHQLIFKYNLDWDGLLLYSAISSSSVCEMPGGCLYVPGIADEDWCLTGNVCVIPVPLFTEMESDKPKILLRDQDADEEGIYQD